MLDDAFAHLLEQQGWKLLKSREYRDFEEEKRQKEQQEFFDTIVGNAENKVEKEAGYTKDDISLSL